MVCPSTLDGSLSWRPNASPRLGLPWVRQASWVESGWCRIPAPVAFYAPIALEPIRLRKGPLVSEAVTRPQTGGDAFVPEAQAALALRVTEGDGAAENELVRLFHRRVLMMTRSRVRNPETARDLTQEVLMAVVLALRKGKLREGEKLAAFVYGTARNIVNGFFRSKPPECVPLFPEAATTDGNDVVQGLHERSLMNRVMEQLDESDRRILDLTLVEGLKPGEIAERLTLSSDVVRARKSRAIKRAIEYVKESSLRRLRAPACQE